MSVYRFTSKNYRGNSISFEFDLLLAIQYANLYIKLGLSCALRLIIACKARLGKSAGLLSMPLPLAKVRNNLLVNTTLSWLVRKSQINMINFSKVSAGITDAS